MKFTPAQSVALDWARGISAQLVLVGHFITPEHSELALSPQNLGVVIFFLLSGLLVTSSVLNKDPSYGFDDFVIDRGARILTPYWPALVFIAAAGLLWGLPGPVDFGTFVGNALLLQDYPLAEYLPFWPSFDRLGTGRPLWSVSAEWWIYMAFGTAFFLRRGIPKLFWPLCAMGVAAVAVLLVKNALATLWIAGALTAVLMRRQTRPLPYPAVGLAFATACAVARLVAADNDFFDPQFCTLLAIAFYFLLQAVRDVPIPRSAALPGAGLAAISYSLYLTHQTVLTAMGGWWPALLVANGVAIAFWWLFERHYRAVAQAVRSLVRPAPALLPHSSKA